MLFRCIALLLLTGMSYWSYAQDLDSLFNLQAFEEESDLQKVINKNVSVAAMKLSSRETPGIVSVITREEIENSGARDLVDMLKLVPGFDVLQDLQFVLGLSLRGSWANEGKVLVMIDGIQMNDLLYQNVALGNRFPISAVERIEIIRGPGSAIYGGSAEYGVINIITKAASELNGVEVYANAGAHADNLGRFNAGVMAAMQGKDLSWDASFFKGRAIISDGLYDDTYDLARESKAEPLNASVGLRYKGLSIRGLVDHFDSREPYSKVSFRSTNIDAKYEIALSPKLTLTPQFVYNNQVPWEYTLFEDGFDPTESTFEVEASRLFGQLNAQYNVSRKVNMNFGSVYFQDRSTDRLMDEKLLTLNNIAFYYQALFKHRLANATVGFRFEKNNRYDGAFVPRVALTKKIENVHFKLLYSKAFRAPALENVLLDTTGAKPEKSDVFEFELGYQFTPEMLLSINAFSISTRDIIIYGSEGGENEWYENYEKSGSRGIELVYSIRKKNWYSTLTYSYNHALNDNTVEKYNVPQTRDQFVGMAAHKVTMNTNFALTSNLRLNVGGVYSGKRYAYVAIDEDELVSEKIDPYVLVNLFLNYKPNSNFSIGAGVFDLLDERPSIPQAYKADGDTYSPIPGRSREFTLKLSYAIPFKKAQ